ncbi:MAG: undecaprenyl-phosphate glucose phosphotransferase [Cyclobacteriaceae bacterium]|nr:MAG: undecaprenyl-phosphate glucose phosphotransferase [Cyclobacteriaceae bacterium]
MKTREVLLVLLLIDLSFLGISFLIVAFFHYGLDYHRFDIIRDTFLLLNFSWIVTYLVFVTEDPLIERPLVQRIVNHGKKYLLFLSIASILALGFNISGISRITFFATITYFFILTFFFSNFFLKYIRIKKANLHNYTEILVVGAGNLGESVQRYFDQNPHRGKVIGFLDDFKFNSDRLNILGRISDFQQVFNENTFDQLIIAIPISNRDKIRNLIDLAEFNGVRPRVIPDYYSLFNRSFETQLLGELPVVNIREFPLEVYINRFWKRVFDLLFSISALILVFPIMLLIALAIKIDSKGPIFYKPIRLGRRGTEFTLFKFRSMYTNDDPRGGAQSTTADDTRITRVGKFIRKYSLDELPQFINVIRHDMSVVGPRPHRVVLNKILQEKTSNYLVRHYVLPGITGWAQVNGWRGPTETRIQYKGRTLHDLWYIENWTFLLDLYIIFLTVFGVKARKNAF